MAANDGGSRSPLFSLGKTMLGQVGAILEQWDASKQVPTVLSTGSTSHLPVEQGWKVSR